MNSEVMRSCISGSRYSHVPFNVYGVLDAHLSLKPQNAWSCMLILKIGYILGVPSTVRTRKRFSRRGLIT